MQCFILLWGYFYFFHTITAIKRPYVNVKRSTIKTSTRGSLLMAVYANAGDRHTNTTNTITAITLTSSPLSVLCRSIVPYGSQLSLLLVIFLSPIQTDNSVLKGSRECFDYLSFLFPTYHGRQQLVSSAHNT